MAWATAVASPAGPPVKMGPVLTAWAPSVQAEKAPVAQLVSSEAAAWEETPAKCGATGGCGGGEDGDGAAGAPILVAGAGRADEAAESRDGR